MQEVQVWSLVKELRSCMLCSVAKTNKQTNKQKKNTKKIFVYIANDYCSKSS